MGNTFSSGAFHVLRASASETAAPCHVNAAVSPASVEFDAEGAVRRVSVTTNQPDYTITGNPDWLALEKNGAERLIMSEKCLEYISEDSIGVLEEGTKSISLASKSASWYNIGKSLGGKVMTMDIPENAAVYVFDRFDNVTYSSYMKDYGSKVYMPENGKIVFLGEDGGKIKIS